MNIDEYAPTTVPNMSASENPARLPGPKRNTATSTMRIVSEVKIDLRIVSWIDLSMSDASDSFLLELSWRFERIRSITTIVSLIE